MKGNMLHRRLWMLMGFAAAFAGDWFLAIRGAPKASPGFLCGVGCFSMAQVFWMAGQWREMHVDGRILVAVGVPLTLFAAVRLYPALPPSTGLAICLYAILTALSFMVAVATRRVFYTLGIGMLLISDLMLGGGLLGAPGFGCLVGSFYLAAEACLLVSFSLADEKCFEPMLRNVWPVALFSGLASFGCFLLAAVVYPGGGYNPFMQMLSALGRTVVREVRYPACHYFFLAGMVLSVCGIAAVLSRAAREAVRGCRRVALGYGAAANVAGLCTIAFVPENVNMFFHNVGCWLAAFGGAAALFAHDRSGADRAWTVSLTAVAVIFGIVLAVQAMGLLPFVPWVPSLQKILIVSFAVWVGAVAWQLRPATAGPERR